MARRRNFYKYPRVLQPKRWCKNGCVPDGSFIRTVGDAQNHIMRFRRKVILCHPVMTFYGNGGLSYGSTSAAGTTNLWRVRFHSGHGAARLRFAIANDDTGSTNPRITIDATIAGGATTSRTIYLGLQASGGSRRGPSSLNWRYPTINISANTTYEILVKAIDTACPLGITAIEESTSDVTADYYFNYEPGAGTPIYDVIRQRYLQGLSEMWRHNGSHLLSWTHVNNTGSPQAAPTFNSATWTNVVDRSSTSVSASTPGFYLGDSGYRLDNRCRLSDGTTLNVVFAVYASTNVGSTGEVRLHDGSSAICSVTGIGTTAQWYTSTTTISNCDTLGKVDLQARDSTPNTLTLHAASLYTYLA